MGLLPCPPWPGLGAASAAPGSLEACPQVSLLLRGGRGVVIGAGRGGAGAAAGAAVTVTAGNGSKFLL